MLADDSATAEVGSSPIQGSVLLIDMNRFLRDVLGFNLFFRISYMARIKRVRKTGDQTILKLPSFDTKRYKKT